MNKLISKIDPYTKTVNLEWESLSGNDFSEKILNGSINMVSSRPDTNRLFLTVNHLEGKDYLILRHPSKDYMLDVGDKFFILLENDVVLDFQIEKKSFLLYNSYNETYKQVFENRILLFKEDLEQLSLNLIKDWRILTSENRKIEGMRSFGTGHNYQNYYDLQKELKMLFTDYTNALNDIENYRPLSKHIINDNVENSEICYLYLMKDTSNGFYKIGISNNPIYREKTLQSEKPTIEIITVKEFSSRKIALTFESSVHKVYDAKRLRGEWFELSRNDLKEIGELMK